MQVGSQKVHCGILKGSLTFTPMVAGRPLSSSTIVVPPSAWELLESFSLTALYKVKPGVAVTVMIKVVPFRNQVEAKLPPLAALAPAMASLVLY